jgi:hypothetical protein
MYKEYSMQRIQYLIIFQNYIEMLVSKKTNFIY